MADRRLPAPLFPWVFAFLMGGAMTAVITAILSLANGTQLAHLPAGWFGDWLLAWLIATPAIVVVAPQARALASRIAVSPALGPGTVGGDTANLHHSAKPPKGVTRPSVRPGGGLDSSDR